MVLQEWLLLTDHASVGQRNLNCLIYLNSKRELVAFSSEIQNAYLLMKAIEDKIQLGAGEWVWGAAAVSKFGK